MQFPIINCNEFANHILHLKINLNYAYFIDGMVTPKHIFILAIPNTQLQWFANHILHLKYVYFIDCMVISEHILTFAIRINQLQWVCKSYFELEDNLEKHIYFIDCIVISKHIFMFVILDD